MTNEPKDNLDIFLDLVVRSQESADRNKFHQALLESEIFSPKIKSKEGKSGLAISEVDGKKLLLFYTTNNNKKLKNPYMGVEGEYALQMILDSHDLDGIYLCSESDSILIILKAEISRILRYPVLSTTEIDRLIADFADNGCQSEEDRTRFNNLFYEGEYYTSIESKDGESMKVSSMEVDGYNLVLFYTQSNNCNLGLPYGGKSGKEILEMVMRMPNIHGIALMSSIDEAWFGFSKQDIPEMLRRKIEL